MTRVFKPDSGQALEIQDEGGSAALTIDTDGDVNLTQDIYLASGKGIYFDGGTTSANYLGGSDAYEEGTFTPSLPGSMAVSGDGIQGYYTKIGKMVTIVISIANGTISNASSYSLGNLPFNNGTRRSSTSGVLYSNAFNDSDPVLGLIQYNTNTIEFLGQGATEWGAANWTNNSGAYLHFSGTYFTSY